MSVRYATREDIAGIVRVINEAYRVEDFFVRGNRTSAEDVEARMLVPDACFIVIDGSEEERLAAAVWLEVKDGRGHFAMLSVDPAQQGKGYGRMLIDAIEKHCRDSDCEALDIEVVNLREELPAFYEALGFTVVETAPFPDTGKLTREAHLVLMTKSI
jgi:ribosomal protein S18 acetylase RimI-like enzyme